MTDGASPLPRPITEMAKLAAMTPNTVLASLMGTPKTTTASQSLGQPKFDLRKRLQMLKPDENLAPALVAKSHEEAGSPPKSLENMEEMPIELAEDASAVTTQKSTMLAEESTHDDAQNHDQDQQMATEETPGPLTQTDVQAFVQFADELVRMNTSYYLSCFCVVNGFKVIFFPMDSNQRRIVYPTKCIYTALSLLFNRLLACHKTNEN